MEKVAEVNVFTQPTEKEREREREREREKRAGSKNKIIF
jgi:hypothetical protein